MASKKNKATVLIVDDDSINKEILAYGLQADYDILLASSGTEALDVAQKEQPDTILLDIVMPDIDGYEVCRRLKSHRDTQKIPIIFSTSKCTDEDEVLGLTMGASDYVTKPFNMALVKARVRNQIQLKKKTDLLEQLASLDGLTEVPNRRFFDDVFEQEWRRALRNQYPISVCMLDIDYFKQFNDNYGHTAGDDCLVAVAKALSSVSNRAGDFLARYGGEEFVFVWPNCSMEDALKMAERARELVEELGVRHDHSKVAPVVTISAGLACLTPLQTSIRKDLLDKADERLYLAKENGRNQVCSDS